MSKSFIRSFGNKWYNRNIISCYHVCISKRIYCRKMTENSDKNNSFHWNDGKIWKQSGINTSWCLLGCSIGDFGTMFVSGMYFNEFVVLHPMIIMGIATVNGLITSFALETGILYMNKNNQMSLIECVKTAFGMSMISMISMEIAMNITDYIIVGSANITWYSVIPSMIAGFIVPWPYNYYRLKKYRKACH